MIENGSTALKMAAALFITIALITVGVIVYNSAADASKMATNEFSSVQTELSEQSFNVYDNTTLSGSQTLNALRKFKDRESFGILVRTGKNTTGTWYNSEVSLSSGSIGNITGDGLASFENTTNQAHIDYINPSGKFKASIVRDSNNAIRAIVFEQQ